jgi:hypothetical protein
VIQEDDLYIFNMHNIVEKHCEAGADRQFMMNLPHSIINNSRYVSMSPNGEGGRGHHRTQPLRFPLPGPRSIPK